MADPIQSAIASLEAFASATSGGLERAGEMLRDLRSQAADAITDAVDQPIAERCVKVLNEYLDAVARALDEAADETATAVKREIDALADRLN